ncbi:MAG: tetratricopeptide repeat protein [Planctomycetota bacterium]
MDTDTYSNADIAKYLNETFVNIRIDTDKDPDTAKKFKVRAIPDTRFLDSGGKELLRIIGHRAEFFDQVKSLGEIAAVELSVKNNPKNVPTLIAASIVYLKLGRIDEAGALLETAIDNDRDNASGKREELFYRLGLVNMKAGNDAKAEAAWAEVGKMDPENKKGYIDDLQFDRCLKQTDEEDYHGAERSLGDFLKRYPDSEHVPEARYLLGMSQFFMEKREDAVSTWKDLIREKPDTDAAKKAEKGLKFAEKKTKK